MKKKNVYRTFSLAKGDDDFRSASFHENDRAPWRPHRRAMYKTNELKKNKVKSNIYI